MDFFVHAEQKNAIAGAIPVCRTVQDNIVREIAGLMKTIAA
ncbi:hypothetical protein [Paenibacillus alkalitolerans]|nr:hypothetical protein [Paenibacillus alkalitolerans]